jgi:hypothetical protein
MGVDDPSTVGTTSKELPPGAIRPTGWIEHQLRLQAEGLTGRLEEIWPDVGPNSAWKGGDGEDWERGPYYLDGLVSLAYVLDDPGLKKHAQNWIEWIISSQDDAGFFGPASNRDWWPRMVATKALIVYADATGDDRVEQLLRRYFKFQLEQLPQAPLNSWGAARGADNALSVWWLYEKSGEGWLLKLIDLIASQTLEWETYLEKHVITGPARVFSHFTHGPNVAMGLKTGAVASLRDHDPAHRHRTERGLANLDRWHGQVHGWFSGDEWLGGPAATAGVETCQVVEMMYTTEVHAKIYKGGIFGDRLESLAYNLLPASCDPRMLAHQYHQQANQIEVSVAPRNWSYAGDDANMFGLEPNFGCCTANLHQGWPKFVRSLWMADDDSTLRIVAYAPAVITTEMSHVPVQISVETNYPFDEDVRMIVGPSEPVEFGIRVRIPDWCDTPTILVNGKHQQLAAVDGYHTIRRQWKDGDVVDVHLPALPRLSHRAGQAVGVRLGALQLSLQTPENWIAVEGAPGLAEWEIHPRRSWNYALDITTVGAWTIEKTAPSVVPFHLQDAPVVVNAKGARVRAWKASGAEASPPPISPIFDVGATERVNLVPYGSARIRITEFPTSGTDLGGA